MTTGAPCSVCWLLYAVQLVSDCANHVPKKIATIASPSEFS